MTIIDAIVLGVLQGVTEFLPVSSSGHLVIFGYFMKINTPGVTFEVLLHFGTLIAVLIYFRKDIMNLLKHPKDKYLWLIFIGIIPAGVIGVLFESAFEKLFDSVTIVALMLLVTGVILWIAEKLSNGSRGPKEMKVRDALVIGFAQSLAIIPGISRAGSTISAGLLIGLNRDTAARYSFLIVIPVIFGATILKVKDLMEVGLQTEYWAPYVIGTVVSGLSGYFAIAILLKMLNTGKLRVFSYYCWAVGSITLLSVII